MYDAVLIDFMHLLSILKTLEWLYWVRHKVILAQFPVSNTGKNKMLWEKQTNKQTLEQEIHVFLLCQNILSKSSIL